MLFEHRLLRDLVVRLNATKRLCPNPQALSEPRIHVCNTMGALSEVLASTSVNQVDTAHCLASA